MIRGGSAVTPRLRRAAFFEWPGRPTLAGHPTGWIRRTAMHGPVRAVIVGERDRGFCRSSSAQVSGLRALRDSCMGSISSSWPGWSRRCPGRCATGRSTATDNATGYSRSILRPGSERAVAMLFMTSQLPGQSTGAKGLFPGILFAGHAAPEDMHSRSGRARSLPLSLRPVLDSGAARQPACVPEDCRSRHEPTRRAVPAGCRPSPGDRVANSGCSHAITGAAPMLSGS